MQRIQALDIAKGIGIVLVVIGHSINGDALLGRIIWSFHMPLFFIIAGMCFNNAKYTDLSILIKNRLRTLLLPAIIFTIIDILLLEVLIPEKATALVESVKWQGFTFAKWFLGVLFMTEIVYGAINKITLRFNRAGGVIVLIAIISYITGCIFSHYNIVGPYSLCTVFSAISFYSIGNLIRPYISLLEYLRHKNIITISGLILLIMIDMLTHRHLDMASNSITVIDFIPAYIGTIMIIVASQSILESFHFGKIKENFLWLGRNTLCIMCIHQLFITLSSTFICPFIPMHSLYKITEQCVVWCECVLTCVIVNRWAPWMLGKQK